LIRAFIAFFACYDGKEALELFKNFSAFIVNIPIIRDEYFCEKLGARYVILSSIIVRAMVR
jgi:hypothetical protein